MTPESTRPKRMRRSKFDKNLPENSQESMNSEKEQEYKSTPKRSKRSDTSSDCSSGGTKDVDVVKSILPLETGMEVNSENVEQQDQTVATAESKSCDANKAEDKLATVESSVTEEDTTEKENVDTLIDGAIVPNSNSVQNKPDSGKNEAEYSKNIPQNETVQETIVGKGSVSPDSSDKENETIGKDVGESKAGERNSLKTRSNIVMEDNAELQKKKEKIMETEELNLGEKTPQSRTQSKPERQSTTKKKKEAAMKRAQKGKKGRSGEGVVETESMESSDDDVPLKQRGVVKQLQKGASDVVEVEEKGGKGTVEKEAATQKDESVEKGIDFEEEDKIEGSNGKNISDVSSDDNVPLASLTEVKSAKCKSIEASGSDVRNNAKDFNVVKNEGSEEFSASQKAKRKRVKGKSSGKTSPLSNRLRSSGKVLRTRGRLPRASLGGEERSLSLKKTVKRRSLQLTLKGSEVDGGEISSDDEKNYGNEKETEQSKEKRLGEDGKDDEDNVEPEQENEVDDQEPRQKHSVTFSEDLMGDTPRKTPEIQTTRGAFAMYERNSDSKLVTVPRKFQKRLARRSILKPQGKSALENSPPLKKQFHPIKVAHIYSPSASPSASILKRRRLIGIPLLILHHRLARLVWKINEVDA